MKKHLLLLIVLLIGILPAFAVEVGKGNESVLSVNASGEVKADPDIANLTITSTARGNTAAEATSLNAQASNKLLSTLKSLGIEEKDIQTGSINVSPVYDFSEDGNSQIIAYEATNSFNVTVRKIDDVGKVVDTVSAAGDYSISGVNFSLEDDKTVRDEAYKLAVQNAKHKAEVIAKETSRSISGIKSIVLNDNGGGIFFAGLESKDSSTPVLPGEVTVSASVTIEYFISR